jgi:MFS family permease
VVRAAAEGFRLIGRSPRLLAIIGVLWIGTLFAYASEGIATPLAEELGQSAAAVGILLAANPLGVTVGGLAVVRLVPPHRREGLVPFLVVLSLLPLVVAGLLGTFAAPGTVTFAGFVALMFVSGLGGAWLIPLNVSFVQAVPPAFRGRAFGVAVAGLYGVQGVGALGAGLVAEGLAPSAVVAVSGALGLLAVVVPLLAFVRTRGHVAPAPARAGSSVS